MMLDVATRYLHRLARALTRVDRLPPSRTDVVGPHWSAYSSFEEYRASRIVLHEALASRRRVEGIIAAHCELEPLEFFCAVHGGMASVGPMVPPIDWREGIVCPRCHLNARMRAVLAIMRDAVPPDAQNYRVYLTEQATPGYAAARELFQDVVGSEYVFDPARRLRLTEYVRSLTGDRFAELNHQDVTALTLPDDSVDAVGCFEVLEHVADYRSALREFARVLRPDGQLVITAPFVDVTETAVLARMRESGEIEHLAPPEYHGDPVADSGVLCFYHFGWDILETLKSSGFRRAQVLEAWVPALGLYFDIKVIVATR